MKRGIALDEMSLDIMYRQEMVGTMQEIRGMNPGSSVRFARNPEITRQIETAISANPLDNLNTILPEGIVYSTEIQQAQRMFTGLNNPGKLEAMYRLGFLDVEEYQSVSAKLLNNPTKEVYSEISSLEDRFFASKWIWNDNELRIIAIGDIQQLLGREELQFFHLPDFQFTRFIGEANVNPSVVVPSKILGDVDQALRVEKTPSFSLNYWVNSPEEAEIAGRELLKKYVVDTYGGNNFDIVSSYYKLELKDPSKPSSYVGRIRRDVQGGNQVFQLRDGSQSVMQIPPHINVEIPRGRIVRGDGSFSDADITIHIFYKPINW